MEFKILSTVATNPGVPRDLLSLYNSNGYSDRLIRQTIEDGYIRERVLGKTKKRTSNNKNSKSLNPSADDKKEIKRHPQKIQVRHCLFLKPEGLRYLASEYSKLGWPGYVDTQRCRKCSVFGRKDTLNLQTENTLCRISEANVFFSMCNAEVLMIPHAYPQTETGFSKEENEPAENSQIKIIRDAAKECDADLLNEKMLAPYRAAAAQLYEYPIRFVPKTVAKEVLGLQDDDRARCKCIGIADNGKKSCLVYCGEGNSFSLPEKNLNKDIDLLTAWKGSRSTGVAGTVNMGILLLRNARQLDSMIRDTEGFRRKEDKYNLHGSLAKMYIVPETKDGIGHLKWIMSADDEEIEREIADDMMARERAVLFKGGSRIQMKVDGLKCAVMCMLEAVAIEQIKKEIGGERAAIVCFSWQRPYLTPFFDNPLFIDAENFIKIEV